jgi:hypothetical protein
MTQPDPTAESTRALLWRHGLPEDVIDGALCLHAQELAAVQRKAIGETDDPVFYEGEAGWLVNLIEPEGAPASSAGVSPATDETAPAVWIDGHPQLEAIAAAVWEQCRTEDSSLVVDDPRNIAVAALAAVLPASVDRADVLREAADHLARQADELWVPGTKAHTVMHADADELRRVAAETRNTTPPAGGAAQPKEAP